MFILVIAGLIAAAIVAATAGSIILNRTSATGLLAVVQSVVLFVLPYAISVLAIFIVYLVVPPVRPPRSALWPPAIGAGVLMVAITQVFTLIAPRLVSANPFYGTLGTVFVSLAWLNLISMVLLIGAAWVRVRMLSDEEVLATLT